ncbi:MAG: hypothetical protein V1492_00685 [Candidatus Micrarchaeota archaeon]
MEFVENAPEKIADTRHLKTKPELAMHTPFSNISKAVVAVLTNPEALKNMAEADRTSQIQKNAGKNGLEPRNLAENLRDAISAIKQA